MHETAPEARITELEATVARLSRERDALLVALSEGTAPHPVAWPGATLADALPQITWTADAAGDIDYFSQAWYDYTGLTPCHMRSHGWTDVLHPEDLPACGERMMQALKLGEPYEAEYRLRGADGNYRWFVGRALPMRDALGVVRYWLGTCTDVQDLVLSRPAAPELTAEAPSESSSWLRLQAIFEHSPLGIVVCDLKGRFLQANPAFQAMSGYSEVELRERGVMAVTAPDDRAAAQEAWPALLSGELRRFSQEKRYVRPDGRQVWAQSSVGVARNAQGDALFLVVTVEDISRRKRTDEQLVTALADLERQRALTATMINAFPGAIAYCGPDFVHRAANDAAARRFGLGCADELVGRKAADFIPEAEAHVRPTAEHVMATGEPVSSYGDALQIPTPNGLELRYRDFLLSPVPANQGGGFVVVSLEADQRVALEQTVRDQVAALQQADRYKDEFLSVVSHELRTPLNFIMGFASALVDEVLGPVNAEQEKALEKILTGSDRMLGLVNDLLDFAKLASGQLSLAPEPTAYPALVQEVADTIAPLSQAKDLALELRLEPGLEATLDSVRVTQVLQNLLSNAIKFTPRGGRVTVSAKRLGDRLHTTVSDTGVGIAAADVPRLFRRFGQLDMSATRLHGGTGLGLVIAEALVKAHGGDIGVTSTLGEGSTFWFNLPLA